MLKGVFLSAVGFILAATTSHANGISISPILLTVAEDGGPASFRVGSNRDTKAQIQVRIFDWRQEDGADVMTEATDVRFSPEFFELEPGMEKTVRMRLPDTQGEGVWRIVIDELPTADDIDPPSDDTSFGMKMRVRYVVSMFASEAADGDALSFDLTGDGADKKLAITNNGTEYARIFDMTLDDAETTQIKPKLIYVLPGSTVMADVVSSPDSPTRISYKTSTKRLTKPLD